MERLRWRLQHVIKIGGWQAANLSRGCEVADSKEKKGCRLLNRRYLGDQMRRYFNLAGAEATVGNALNALGSMNFAR